MRALTHWFSPDNLHYMEWGLRRQLSAPYSVARDHAAFLRSRHAPYSSRELESVCIVLGPYRNLTTLTVSVAALHPSCQVLNHAASRILPVAPANFLLDYTDHKFENFVRWAMVMSTRGRRGIYGGSVLHAHAFDDERLRAAYRRRYGDALIKPVVRCLLWKDSMRLQNYIRREAVDLPRLFAMNPKIRFLLPIRHPLDCAMSNMRTGHARFLVGRSEFRLPEVLEAILGSIAWFLKHQDVYPTRFESFTESDISSDFLLRLSAFLGVEPDREWLDETPTLFSVRRPHRHEPEARNLYMQLLDKHLGPWPAIAAKLSDAHVRKAVMS